MSEREVICDTCKREPATCVWQDIYRHSEFRRMVKVFGSPNGATLVRLTDLQLQQTLEILAGLYGVTPPPKRKSLTARRMAAEWMKARGKPRDSTRRGGDA